MAEAKTAQAKKDWVEVISLATKVEKASVRKVINATVEALRDEIAKEERVSFPRLGSFIRRPGKEDTCPESRGGLSVPGLPRSREKGGKKALAVSAKVLFDGLLPPEAVLGFGDPR